MTKQTTVQISTADVGKSFATRGIIRRGFRVIYRGPERPFGFVSAALEDARNWAGENGYVIREREE